LIEGFKNSIAAKTPRGKAFDEHEPELTDAEIEPARAGGKIAISFKGKPVLQSMTDIEFLAVKFALADGSFEVVLLDQFSARALGTLIDAVNRLEWKTDAVRPKGPQH
jgi:hypothetical protein